MNILRKLGASCANAIAGRRPAADNAQNAPAIQIAVDEGEGNGKTGVLSFIGLACCIVAVLWVVSASSPFLANALLLDGWRFWCALALGLMPFALVLGVIVYVFVRLHRMPRVEQLSEAAFGGDVEELRNRLVSKYLSKFGNPVRYAVDNGFSAPGNGTDEAPVVVAIRRLRGENTSPCPDSREWLRLFKEFQAMQDAKAREVISAAWKRVAIATAASPWKVVDVLAVVYISTLMVARLARIYNRRTSRHAAFRLVCRWFVGIYIAGELGDATQGATEWACANDLISATFKPLVGFAGKIAEGGANAFLVYRLGNRAIAYFRPLALAMRSDG